MLTRIDFWRIAAALLLALNVGLLAYFLARPSTNKREGPRKIIIERLHFDAGQVAAYELLIKQHRKDIEAKEREVQAAKQQLYGLLQGNDFSAQDSLTTRIGQLQMDFERIHFSHFKDIKSLCNGSQTKYFDALAGELASFFGLPKYRKNKEAK